MSEPLAPQPGGVRSQEADAEEPKDGRALKRKKTVTWADAETKQLLGTEDRAADQMDSQDAPHFQPAVGQRQASPSDPLFVDLDMTAIHKDSASLQSSQAALLHDQLMRRRLERCEELITDYETELWALADELLLRRWTLIGSTTVARGSQVHGQLENDAVARKPSLVATLRQSGVKGAWSLLHGHMDGHLPSPEQIERLVVSLPLLQAEDVEALRKRVVTSRSQFLRKLPELGRRESAAAATAAKEMDSHGAVAALCGRAGRYYLLRTAVTVGRAVKEKEAGPGTARNVSADLDIDLTAEGPDVVGAVSRLQAQIFLDGDAGFKIKCLGKRALSVNGQRLMQGGVTRLPHLSLVRTGPVALLFVINRPAVDRLGKRCAALSVA